MDLQEVPLESTLTTSVHPPDDGPTVKKRRRGKKKIREEPPGSFNDLSIPIGCLAIVVGVAEATHLFKVCDVLLEKSSAWYRQERVKNPACLNVYKGDLEAESFRIYLHWVHSKQLCTLLEPGSELPCEEWKRLCACYHVASSMEDNVFKDIVSSAIMEKVEEVTDSDAILAVPHHVYSNTSAGSSARKHALDAAMTKWTDAEVARYIALPRDGIAKNDLAYIEWNNEFALDLGSELAKCRKSGTGGVFGRPPLPLAKAPIPPRKVVVAKARPIFTKVVSQNRP
ncbi:hypothetical protein BU16DRAFT_584540 [Lophium mytilinum]|uniref:BTB domain-containing protein n=1 Tax=Lophium mytilinum TaxID=390894 RepID=A0A6A6QJ52_9PEZI|nr:hypothetical protein BU16DRAFT_584540 [Lophium mytilinum]